jgi:hypothetical protein
MMYANGCKTKINVIYDAYLTIPTFLIVFTLIDTSFHSFKYLICVWWETLLFNGSTLYHLQIKKTLYIGFKRIFIFVA